MNKHVFASALLTVAFAAVAPVAPTAFASGGESPVKPQPADEMQALKKKFEERFPKVRALKQAGVVGETSDGYLDYVEERSADAAAIVDAENADRRKLYELIAKDEGVAPETVARRNALRNFERARKGEWIRRDGKWEQKS